MTLPNKISLLAAAALLSVLIGTLPAQTETVERIYAVVNDQIITYSEMKNSELQLTNMLRQQHEGEELTKEIEKMKSTLLDNLINQKLLLSKAKAKNYDLNYQVESVIKEIKTQNNIASDDELRRALTEQGIDYETWRLQISQGQMQQQLIYEEIGSKISIDNTEIMGYYREHLPQFTVPLTLTLDAIYIQLSLEPAVLAERKAEIDLALEQGQAFSDVAEKFSQLPAEENKARLGTFKSGELDPVLEDQAKLLTTVGSVSTWIETQTGWYRLSLVERVEEHLKEYKDVRGMIENILKAEIQEEKLKTYIEDLKRSSYIRIIE